MGSEYRRCCGMDLHKKTVVACVLAPDGANGKPLRKVYGTFRRELTRMRGWLKQLHVTDIAMESTGVYWRPVWNVLEGHFARLLLANPKQVKALEGRKSDHRDARRIGEFLQDGRLDPSFVPPPEIRRLRDLTRCRLTLLRQRNEIHNKIRDLLETANVKLSSVMTNLLGVSGQRIIQAMVEGEESAEILSWKVKGKLRPKEKQVRESLKGCFDALHRTLLTVYWKQYRFLTAQVELMETKIATAMEPYADLVELLDGIPGVDRLVAWTAIAEMGVDMERVSRRRPLRQLGQAMSRKPRKRRQEDE
jgi:transposase